MRAFVVLTLLLSGCNLVPVEKHQEIRRADESAVAATTTTKVVEAVRSRPAPPQPLSVEVAGKGHTVTVATSQPAATLDERVEAETGVRESSSSRGSSVAFGEISIPLGAKLILLGIGLIILAIGIGFIWRAIRRSAAGTALRAANDWIDSRINSLKDQAMTETDPAKIAVLSATVSSLERDRGEMNRNE